MKFESLSLWTNNDLKQFIEIKLSSTIDAIIARVNMLKAVIDDKFFLFI